MAAHENSSRSSRRSFLSGGGALLSGAFLGGMSVGMGGLEGILRGTGRVSAEEAQLPAGAVRFRDEIEPLVRFIEDTPRAKLLEEMATKIRGGLSYREVLAALLLAGVRNVQPRPYVGFKFHSVLVVHSAHLASLAAPDSERWLPILWALDYFKSAQARDVSEGDWTMSPVNEKNVPAASHAKADFVAAMDAWDEEASDAAIAALARSASIGEIFELFWKLGSRDYRSIGHKAIYVANSYRTLQVIGYEHAEPVLRSLAYALLEHKDGNPSKNDHAADRPFRRNVELVKKLKTDGTGGKYDNVAFDIAHLALRDGTEEFAAQKVVELVNRGVHATTIWDAIFIAASELVLRQAAIVPLHAITTANALHFAFWTASNEETRKIVLLQAASFLPLFRGSAEGRGKLAGARIDTLAPTEGDGAKDASIESVFAKLRSDTSSARSDLLAHMGAGGDAREIIRAARLLIFRKGDDAHAYKFSSAVLEDYFHVSPQWRDRFLAANLGLLHGSTERDTGLVKRVHAAFAE